MKGQEVPQPEQEWDQPNPMEALTRDAFEFPQCALAMSWTVSLSV
jgi:hypothetical protein